MVGPVWMVSAGAAVVTFEDLQAVRASLTAVVLQAPQRQISAPLLALVKAASGARRPSLVAPVAPVQEMLRQAGMHSLLVNLFD